MEKENTIYELTSKMFKRVSDNHKINLYEKILELRKFEIENFWKRAIFFWGTIALIYVAYFRLEQSNAYIFIVPLIGLLFNIIFSLSIRGSKYWQEHYEDLASQYETSLNFVLFSHSKETGFTLGDKGHFLSKPQRFSVSKLAMLLADLSVIVWFFLWVKTSIENFNSLSFDFSIDNKIDIPTLIIILTHIVLIGYFIFFLIKGKVYHKPTARDNFKLYESADYRGEYEEKIKEKTKSKMN